METRFSNYYSKYPAKLYVDSVTPGDAEVMDVRDVKLWHLRRRAGGKRNRAPTPRMRPSMQHFLCYHDLFLPVFNINSAGDSPRAFPTGS
jgi:hypothetical protein